MGAAVERRGAPPSYVTGGRARLASVPGGPTSLAAARGASQTPRRLPALHPCFGSGKEKGRGRVRRPQKFHTPGPRGALAFSYPLLVAAA